MPNDLCHFELTTRDVGAAKEFYGKVFDWTFEDMPMPEGTYTGIQVPEGPGGGMMTPPAPEVPTAWMVYIRVDDAAATLAQVEELGGAVHMGRSPVPGMGWMGVCADPTGGVFGIWQEDEDAR